MKQNITRFLWLSALATALLGVLASCGQSAVEASAPEDASTQAQTAMYSADAAAAETGAASAVMELDDSAPVRMDENDAIPLSRMPENVPAPETGMPVQQAPSTQEVALVEGPSKAPSAPASQPAAAPLTRSAAIQRGDVVLSGKKFVPCFNAAALLSFYEEYRAGREDSVSIYSFRTQNENERRYTRYVLTGAAGKATSMTEDTTHYYDATLDASEKQAAAQAGVRRLGTFTMAKNKYGFLIVDVDSPDGKLQYHYQVTGHDELYPSTVTYAEEAALYLAPLAGTGILELGWASAEELLKTGVFPQAFDHIAGAQAVGNSQLYWSNEKKTYRFPRELVEKPLMSRFNLTAEQLRTLPEYDSLATTYDFVLRPSDGLADLRLLAVSEPESPQDFPALAAGESLLQLRYEFFDAENGAPVARGKMTVLVHEDDSFRYLRNELLPPPASEE